MLLDPKDMIEAIAEVVGEQVRAATAPLAARIAELEARHPLKGDPGQDADPEMVKQLVDEAVRGAVAAIALPEAPAPIEPDMAAIGEMVTREVATAVAALPKAEDGRSVTIDDVRPLVDEAVGKAVAEIPRPKDGEDGRSFTLDDVRPLVDEAVGKAVAAIPVPKDGIGAAGAVIDRGGNLVLTLTDGSVRELGQVVGRDADVAAITATLRQLVDEIPRPKDGMDGLGFDDFSVDAVGPRSFVLRFARGDLVKTFPFTLPVVLDAGVWREGKHYEAGDGVTWAGSYWIAQKDTAAKPDSGDGWRLAVKRGRDAKPAEPVSIQNG